MAPNPIEKNPVHRIRGQMPDKLGATVRRKQRTLFPCGQRLITAIFIPVLTNGLIMYECVTLSCERFNTLLTIHIRLGKFLYEVLTIVSVWLIIPISHRGVDTLFQEWDEL